MTFRPQPLANYHAVLIGSRIPGFLKCSSIRLDADLSSDEETLWSLHDEAMAGLGGKGEPGGAVTLLDLKAELARRLLSPCRLCERRCKVDRLAGEKGFCRVTESRISSRFVHMGEEPDLIPSYTIFFSGCTFQCVFCQNWDISQRESGMSYSPSFLAEEIDARFGEVRNINWVGGEPTPNLPFILEVLTLVNEPIPQIWNSNMYMTEEAMSLLRGVIDVYLADFKWGRGDCSKKYSRVHRYWEVVSRNHRLASDHAEIVLRHLVMPNHVECCSRPILEWVAENLDRDRLLVNVMDQYRPEYKAEDFEEINRMTTDSEFLNAYKMARQLGLQIT